ncbi:hypothetical protein SRHO_G00255640 [Serrasalmus rhombeus]
MKETECSPLEQPWASFITRNHCLRINALDFSDLWDEEDLDQDLADDDSSRSESSPVQNPGHNLVPPTPPPAPPLAPPLLPGTSPIPLESGRRTLRLHWRELLSLQPLPRVSRFGPRSIWAALEPVHLDTNRLEYLFKTKSKVLPSLTGGKQKQPRVSVLGVKRSNIVTIALSSLPPPHLLPPAIYSMDSSVLDREDVQRLQSLVPSEEELNLIKQAKAQAPHCPLAPAEQCLLTLGNIKHLSSRLQLWAFALDYDTLEREIAEPLFHLKLAMEQLAANQTFRCILATVLAIGNFLNGCKARGFELSYLGKLSQVRDTHSRQPLLQPRVCVAAPALPTVLRSVLRHPSRHSSQQGTVQASLDQLESLCKASWEQLRLLEKDGGRKKGGGGGGEERGTGNEGSLRQRLPPLPKGVRGEVEGALGLSIGGSSTGSTHSCCTWATLAPWATRHAILQQREREQEREKEREKDEERGRDPSTPKSKAKAPQSPSQDHEEQSKLEEVLKTPASSSRFDFSLPRRRSKTPNTRGSLPRRLKW